MKFENDETVKTESQILIRRLEKTFLLNFPKSKNQLRKNSRLSSKKHVSKLSLSSFLHYMKFHVPDFCKLKEV